MAIGSAVVDGVRRAWGIEALVVRRLDGEADDNWLLDSPVGRFVLKVSAHEAYPGSLQLQVAVLDALRVGMPQWSFPQPMRARDGAAIVDLSADGVPGLARLLSYVAGQPLASVAYRSAHLLRGIGALAAGCVTSLRTVTGDGSAHDWGLRQLPSSVDTRMHALPTAAQADVRVILSWFPDGIESLPQALIHHDLNDHNILVRTGENGGTEIAGAIDVGDATRTARVAELAIAAAYAMLRTDEPLAAAAEVVAGFNGVLPLTDAEVEAVFPLAAARLTANAATWAHRIATGAAGDYGRARSQSTLPALARLAAIDPAYALTRLRAVCGLVPFPRREMLDSWLDAQPAVAVVADAANASLIDMAPTSNRFDDAVEPPRPQPSFAPHGGARMDRAGRRRGDDGPATTQLGVDVFAAAGEFVRTPLAGVVTAAAAAIVVFHPDAPVPLQSIVAGLDPTVRVGDTVRAGDEIGRIANREDPSHVHWTLTTIAAAPQFVVARDADIELAPDPTRLLGLTECVVPARTTAAKVVAARDARVARSQRSYYRNPPLLTRAAATWFTDEQGRQYLDAMNNVAHVGHGHPRVVDAGVRQMRRLNTNSRFVYESLGACADRIAGLLPDGLDVVFFTCTGSESNDLALRIARTCTGREHIAVLGGAYHGNTTAVTAISPDRFDGPGGAGAPATTHVLPQPDRYRGAYGYDHPDPGAAYAADARRVIDAMVAGGTPPAAVFTEPLQGTAGQIVLPHGYLAAVYDAVRATGGLCVGDEVQVGLGRLGTTYWGFEQHGVVPDIVTIGKPLGNGHPISAVVTTRAIADAFDNGMRYFNTFGGNPVSCAIALAVLDVVEEEGLQERARVLGDRLLGGLHALGARHEIIGDVRGLGLYAGVELVHDRDTKEPFGAAGLPIVERMMELGVLTYPNGPFANILKLKPPMVSTESDIDLIVEVLDEVLTTGW